MERVLPERSEWLAEAEAAHGEALTFRLDQRGLAQDFSGHVSRGCGRSLDCFEGIPAGRSLRPVSTKGHPGQMAGEVTWAWEPYAPRQKILLVTPDVETYPGSESSHVKPTGRECLARWRETEARKHWGAFGAGDKSFTGRCHNLLSGSYRVT